MRRGHILISREDLARELRLPEGVRIVTIGERMEDIKKGGVAIGLVANSNHECLSETPPDCESVVYQLSDLQVTPKREERCENCRFWHRWDESYRGCTCVE